MAATLPRPLRERAGVRGGPGGMRSREWVVGCPRLGPRRGFVPQSVASTLAPRPSPSSGEGGSMVTRPPVTSTSGTAARVNGTSRGGASGGRSPGWRRRRSRAPRRPCRAPRPPVQRSQPDQVGQIELVRIRRRQRCPVDEQPRVGQLFRRGAVGDPDRRAVHQFRDLGHAVAAPAQREAPAACRRTAGRTRSGRRDRRCGSSRAPGRARRAAGRSRPAGCGLSGIARITPARRPWRVPAPSCPART